MAVTVFDKPIFPGAKLIVAELTVTNTSGSYSNTVTDDRISASMKPYALEIDNPSIFNAKISVSAGAGQYTVSCSDVAGSTTIKISFLKVLDDPTSVTSTEFDLLSNQIGTLSNLTTTAKTSVVAAINEVVANKISTSDIANNLTTTTEGKVLDARQGKSLSDAVANKVNTSDIANNLTTTGAGKVLDARQGKALSDTIGSLNSLTTSAKGSAVAAINEIDSDVGSLATRVTNIEAVETIWTGSATSNTNLTLTKNYTLYKFLLITMQTNAELMTMLIYVPHLDTGKWYFNSVSLFSGSGQQTDFTYKSTCGVKFHDNNKMDVTNAYNNVNLQLKLTRVVGVRK